MTPADLQIPERGSAPVEDPAVVAGKEAEAAKAAFLALPHSTVEDEAKPEWQAAEQAWLKAGRDFADTPATSIAGMFVKLRALVDDIIEDVPPAETDPSWEYRHTKTILAFLEGFTGAPPIVDDAHPDATLLALWQEYGRVVKQWKASPDISDDEANVFHEHTSRIECQICNTTPHTPAGLVMLVKLLASFQEIDPTFTDGRDGTLSKNILAALERLTPGLAEIGWGPVAAPDPAVVAGNEAAEAAAAFNAISESGAEPGAEFDAAQERTSKADDAFADAPITTAAGALAKMREIAEMSMTGQDDDTSLDARHFKTVVAFLEGRMAVAKPDPAVAALAEYRAAKAADNAFSDEDARAETPEYIAAGDRRYAAGDAVIDVVPTSMAGVGAKVRFIVDHQERGNDLWPAFDCMAKSMLPFLEGAPAPAPKPDPVVILFAKWAIIRDEANALSAADPKGTDAKINEQWENALSRLDALEDQIMETPATSMRGVAIKIRIASHYILEAGDVDKRYATPSRDIDYVEATGGSLGADGYVISALRDAERLAGV